MGMFWSWVINSVMQAMINFWKQCGLYDQIKTIKEVFEEPKNSDVFKQVFESFSEKMMKLGRLLLSVLSST